MERDEAGRRGRPVFTNAVAVTLLITEDGRAGFRSPWLESLENAQGRRATVRPAPAVQWNSAGARWRWWRRRRGEARRRYLHDATTRSV